MKKPNKNNAVKTVYFIVLLLSIVVIAIYFVFGLSKNNLAKTKNFTEEEIEETIPEDISIGDMVTYIPKPATYNWAKEYCSETLADDIILDNQTEEFNITNWRVFNINEEKGIIELISESPTIGKTFLSNAQGYNNGVKLLNDACSELYGNNEKNIKSRSIKLEDIEEKIPKETLETIQNKFGEFVKYNNQVVSKFENQNNIYPAIYEEEKLSVINGNKKEDGLERSEQLNFYPRNNEHSVTNVKQAGNIQPYQTFYRLYLKPNEEQTNITNIISCKNKNESYWIATRAVDIWEDSCVFTIYNMMEKGTGTSYVFTSSYLTMYGDSSLRPIVSLKANLLTKDDLGNWQVQ